MSATTNAVPNEAQFDAISARVWHDIARLRTDVFVVEQECAYPEFDGRDVEPTTRHVWFEADGCCIAYLRVLDDGDERRIGRVVTVRAHRGRGHAARLLEHVLASTQGPWVLAAQTYLRDWYGTFGFDAQGDSFVEYGIPHVVMRWGIA